MIVLHILPSVRLERGGPSRSVRQLVGALRARGLEVSLAAEGATAEGDLPLAHLRVPGYIPDRSSRRALARAIGGADVVEIHSLWNGTASTAAALCRRAKVPYVLTPRGMLDPICLVRRRWRKRLYGLFIEDATLAGSSGFHFLSDEECRRARVRRTLSDDEVAVSPNGAPRVTERIPNGVLAGLVPETRASGRPVIVYLGRLDPIKGIELQIRALALLPEPVRPVLLLVGPDFGEGPRLERLARAEGVEEQVIQTGPIYGLERFSVMVEADLVVLTSVYDCNPVVANEALAVGACVLATEGCSLGRFAAEGALVQVPRTTADFAGALERILADREAMARTRSRGQEFARTQLDWHVVVEPLIRLYERLVSHEGQA